MDSFIPSLLSNLLWIKVGIGFPDFYNFGRRDCPELQQSKYYLRLMYFTVNLRTLVLFFFHNGPIVDGEWMNWLENSFPTHISYINQFLDQIWLVDGANRLWLKGPEDTRSLQMYTESIVAWE